MVYLRAVRTGGVGGAAGDVVPPHSTPAGKPAATPPPRPRVVQSSRHTPCAVAASRADGTRSVPATVGRPRLRAGAYNSPYAALPRGRAMAGTVEFYVGTQPWAVTVPPEKAVGLRREPFAAPAASPRKLVRDALEKPFGFEPLRRALTPDDHVTIVVDEQLPHLAELLAGVLEHLATAGIQPEAVTLLTTPPATDQGWIDELPDEFAD